MLTFFNAKTKRTVRTNTLARNTARSITFTATSEVYQSSSAQKKCKVPSQYIVHVDSIAQRPIRGAVAASGKPRPNLARQFERFSLYCFTNPAAANALHADFHRLGTTLRRCSMNLLQVRAEIPTSFASNFRTDSTKVFCFTASFNRVTLLGSFSTNITPSCHRSDPNLRSNVLLIKLGSISIQAILATASGISFPLNLPRNTVYEPIRRVIGSV